MKKITPSFPGLYLTIAIVFFLSSLAFLLSPFSDLKMQIAAILSASFSIAIVWYIDHTFLSIECERSSITFKGYFSIRNIQFEMTEIEGYQINERVDQFNGLHDEITITTNAKHSFTLSRMAYRSNYDEVLDFMNDCGIRFLGKMPFRYAKILKVLVPIVFLVSGILAALVRLLKMVT
jgi:hypothetical protein